MEKPALAKIEEEDDNNNVLHDANEVENAEPVEQLPLPYAQPRGKARRALKMLQENPVTKPCCPPTGEVATTLTLLLTIIAIFLSFWTMLGPKAFFGGSVFAFLVIIFLSFLCGKLVFAMDKLLLKAFNVNIGLPPMLGMLLVGILLENIPYNIGPFAKEECIPGYVNASLDKNHFVAHDDVLFDNNEEYHDIHHSVHKRFPRNIPSELHDNVHDDTNDLDCDLRYIGHDLDHQIKKTLRSICLTVILLMEGLELDPVALKNLTFMVVKATFIPCLVEAAAVGILSHLFLDFPWTVSFMVGFIIAEVSPAVIIPCMSSLYKQGYGVDKGIPSLVIAACSGYEVVAVSGFGIFMGLTFSQGGPVWKLILQGPIEVLLGVSFGVLWGFLAQWIPNKDHHHVAFFRWLILLGGGLIALFGSHLIDFDAAGGLATIIMAFVAGIEWRKEGWNSHNPVSKTFHRMWIILEPAVFALIGTEIEIKNINPKTLGLSILVLVIALAIRLFVNYRAVNGVKFNAREKIFMAVAWIPKATVHGPIFLDNVMKHHNHHWENPEDKQMYVEMGNDILTMAVISILITAPLGAFAMLALGPKLLETNQKTDTTATKHKPDE